MPVSEKPRLLIVDDDDDIREQMRWSFSAEYQVLEAGDRAAALARYKEAAPPLVTLDMGLPPHEDGSEEGLATLEAMLAADPTTKVVVITGKSDVGTALGALERGAFDYLNKPVEIDELRVILRRALTLGRLSREAVTPAEAPPAGLDDLIGRSPPMQEVFATVRRAAGSMVPVLVLGESGTGKELVARALHNNGPRKAGPFVAINCGAIPENLLESELFGYEKGAFTGAQSQVKGRFELARGGTLFLDEIGDLPLPLQVKLLRFLQELRLTRVGGREEIAVDTRVVAATNADLKASIAAGRFREDLYYRLAIVTINLPPLRRRGEDLVLLAQALLRRYVAAEGRGPAIKGFSRDALLAVQGHAWPGNVRELENHLKRAAVMAEGPWITVQDLQLPAGAPAHAADGGGTLRAVREAAERDLIQKALARNGGNISRTAVELGVSRPTMHELISKYGLRK